MYTAMAALHGVYYTKGYHTDLDTTKSIFAFSFRHKAYDFTDFIVLLQRRISPLYEGQRRDCTRQMGIGYYHDWVRSRNTVEWQPSRLRPNGR